MSLRISETRANSSSNSVITFLVVIYLGGLNLAYTELVSIAVSLPIFPKLVAVYATP